MREIREATKALNPIKTKLRAFEGMKVSVPGGRVAIGVSKEAVYGRRPASSSNLTCVNSGLSFCSARVFARLDSLGKEGRTLSTSTETQIRRFLVWAFQLAV